MAFCQQEIDVGVNTEITLDRCYIAFSYCNIRDQINLSVIQKSTELLFLCSLYMEILVKMKIRVLPLVW